MFPRLLHSRVIIIDKNGDGVRIVEINRLVFSCLLPCWLAAKMEGGRCHLNQTRRIHVLSLSLDTAREKQSAPKTLLFFLKRKKKESQGPSSLETGFHALAHFEKQVSILAHNDPNRHSPLAQSSPMPYKSWAMPHAAHWASIES